MNMKRIQLIGVMLLAVAATAAQPVRAASTLSIRLVQTTPGPDSSPELADVLPALRRTLAAQGFRLRTTRQIPLPARQQVALADAITVRCEGDARNLEIRVFRDNTQLAHTRVNLKGGAPLILGGFQADDGSRLLVVFVAR